MNTDKILKIKSNNFDDTDTLFDQEAINFLKINNWINLYITKFYVDSKHICLFYNDGEWVCTGFKKMIKNDWYLKHYGIIFPLNLNQSDIFISEYDTNLLLKLLSDLNIDIDLLDKKYVYHFLLFDPVYKYVCNNVRGFSHLKLLWVNDREKNIIDDSLLCTEIKKVQVERKIEFENLDELHDSINIMNSNETMNKNIINGGYYIRSVINKKEIYCVIHTDIYNNVLNMLWQNENKYIKFLELYQENKLNDIVSFVHKYPSDVVRRINISIKTIAKEILNIYHLTRRQQNPNLYNSLPPIYKEVIYNLHKIYVNEKCDEYSALSKISDNHNLILLDKSNNDLDLEYRKKKSISVDIVYNYIKNMKNYDLLKIFEYRRTLINTLENINYNHSHIFYNNIDLKVQLELMFSIY